MDSEGPSFVPSSRVRRIWKLDAVKPLFDAHRGGMILRVTAFCAVQPIASQKVKRLLLHPLHVHGMTEWPPNLIVSRKRLELTGNNARVSIDRKSSKKVRT